MDARLIALGGAGLAGLIAGAAFWALSGGQAQGEALDALDARLTAISTRSRSPLDRPSDALAQSLATPLFAASGSASEVDAEVAIQLFGVVRSPGRTAALIGIGAAPADWLALGESRNGVTLRAVTSSGATVATISGEREVMLGMPSQTALAGAPSTGGPPPGFKSPPPPASAPGMPQ